MKLLLRLSYLGTNYCGYQVQPNGITVQSRLNEATRMLFGGPCDIVGCSRTDSGVHANEFCAAVTRRGTNALETSIPLSRIPLAMSAHLPPDIAVFDAAWVEAAFHPRYDVKEKEYLYRIYNRPVCSPFEAGRACHIPRTIDDGGLERMRRAAAYFLGKQDFSAYMAQGSRIVDPVREIYGSAVERQGDIITYRVRANGFLYNMVRILAGTLLAVAEGKLEPDHIPLVTASRDRSRAGPTMPPEGLYLNRVVYPQDPFVREEGKP